MKVDRFVFSRFISKSDFPDEDYYGYKLFNILNGTDNEDELKKIIKETAAPLILKLEKDEQDIFKFNCFKLKYVELHKYYCDQDNRDDVEISIWFSGVCYYDDITRDGKKLYKQNICDFDNMKITNNMIKILIYK